MRLAPAAVLLGLAAVAAARLATLPRTPWEYDEVLFIRGVEDFDPLHHRPHPPGYPLLIGLGKLFALIAGDPFRGLVALSVVASLGGFLALVAAYRRLAPGEDPSTWRIGVAGALLFHLSPAMLVYGPLALSDAPALCFLSLALAAGAVASRAAGAGAAVALGACASAAIGCRPQLAVAVVPALAVALWLLPDRRPRVIALAAFGAVSLAWLVPLLVAVGGPAALVELLAKQAGYVAAYDAALPRVGRSPAAILTRFLAHPWGQRWASLPILALALGGAVVLLARALRRGRSLVASLRATPWLPLAVLAAVDLGFALLVMNPDDATRYALPSLLAVAFAAAVGADALGRRLRFPAAPYAVAAAGAVAWMVYVWPLVGARATTASPPAQAAEWARQRLPARSAFLVDESLTAHASQWLGDAPRWPVDRGLQTYADRADVPLYLLADGESRWPGAVAFSWPECDAYGKLTRGFYRVVSLSPIPPEHRYRTVRGVYAYEPTAREADWRWLGPDAALRLFPRGARAATVTLGLHRLAPWPSNEVVITVGGVEAARLEVPREERRTAVLALPAGASTELAFHSRDWFTPAASGRGDRRRLSVQLLGLELGG